MLTVSLFLDMESRALVVDEGGGDFILVEEVSLFFIAWSICFMLRIRAVFLEADRVMPPRPHDEAIEAR